MISLAYGNTRRPAPTSVGKRFKEILLANSVAEAEIDRFEYLINSNQPLVHANIEILAAVFLYISNNGGLDTLEKNVLTPLPDDIRKYLDKCFNFTKNVNVSHDYASQTFVNYLAVISSNVQLNYQLEQMESQHQVVDE